MKKDENKTRFERNGVVNPTIKSKDISDKKGAKILNMLDQ